MRRFAVAAVTMVMALSASQGSALADDESWSSYPPAGYVESGMILLETETALYPMTIYQPSTTSSGFTYTATNHFTGETTRWTTSRDDEFKALLADGTGYAYVGNRYWKSSDAGANWRPDASKTATRLYRLSLPLSAVLPWEMAALTPEAVDGDGAYLTGTTREEWDAVTFAPRADTLSSGEFTFDGRPVTSASTTCPLGRDGSRTGQVCVLTVNGQQAVTLAVRTTGRQEINIGNVEKKFTRTDISKYLGPLPTGDAREDNGIAKKQETLRTQFFRIAAGLWKKPADVQAVIGVRGVLYSGWYDNTYASDEKLYSARTYYANTGWPVGTVNIAAAWDTDDLFRGYRLATNGLITTSGRTTMERLGADPLADPSPTFLRESRYWTVCRVTEGADYAECATSYVSKRVANRLLNTISR